MIPRPAGCLRRSPYKAHIAKIELINKHVDNPNRIVLAQFGVIVLMYHTIALITDSTNENSSQRPFLV
jgi:hypothetical protein